MESFSLIDNALMSIIDKNSQEPPRPLDLKNTLKTLVTIQPLNTYSTGTIYNKKFTFDIPREYDNLSNLYIKCYLSTGSVTVTPETGFSPKIFKEVTLRTKKGTTLQTITPSYTGARLDSLYGSELYTAISVGLQPDGAGNFSDGIETCFVPLFFFFSEGLETSLNTRCLEQLELECVTNDNTGLLGLGSTDLTSATFELFALYHDINNSSKITDFSYTNKINVPKYLFGSYNCFQEDVTVISTGSTRARLLLRCPFPTFAIHVTLIANDSTQTQINTLRLNIAGRDLVNLDYRINYQMYGFTSSFLESGTFTYFFSRNKTRNSDSGLITFSKSMFPCYLDVTFPALSSDSSLIVLSEYRTQFNVNLKGEISLNTSDMPGTLQQANSSNDPIYNQSASSF